jgi:hypothetical protein
MASESSKTIGWLKIPLDGRDQGTSYPSNHDSIRKTDHASNRKINYDSAMENTMNL